MQTNSMARAYTRDVSAIISPAIGGFSYTIVAHNLPQGRPSAVYPTIRETITALEERLRQAGHLPRTEPPTFGGAAEATLTQKET